MTSGLVSYLTKYSWDPEDSGHGTRHILSYCKKYDDEDDDDDDDVVVVIIVLVFKASVYSI